MFQAEKAITLQKERGRERNQSDALRVVNSRLQRAICSKLSDLIACANKL